MRGVLIRAPAVGVLLAMGALWGCGQALAQVPQKAAIASAHPRATAVGHAMLARGGNAFDAAIAVTAVLAVVEPYGSGIGGGGFYLLQKATGKPVVLDARERAPLAAHRDMYTDANGEVIPGLSVDGPLAAAIPGIPAALVHLADNYGNLPLSQSLAPAIEVARDGFEVDPIYRRLASFRLAAIRASEAARTILLHDDKVPPLGHLLKQEDLANTLQILAQQGFDGFYNGAIAEQLVAGSQRDGGIWRLSDLREYRVVERPPISVNYRGMRVVSAPPPSSGGVALGEILSILAGYGNLAELSEARRVHLISEAMRRAYRDRALYLGDSDFVDVPIAKLTHPLYAEGLRAGIHPDKATPSELLPGVETGIKGGDTSHFSILDSAGNRVAATLSINYPFGSGYIAAGTGVLLNNEMDDFSIKPGVPNLYGLVGAEANAITPGKRMLSSMSPTFAQQGERFAILGTPGGSRIITMVLLSLLDFARGDSSQQMVARPRFHHQYLPDHIAYEPQALTQQSLDTLTAMGHTVKAIERRWGNMQVVVWNQETNEVTAASDPRGIGAAEVR